MNNNYNSNTIVDGRAAHMTDTTRQSAPEHPPPPLPDHAGSIPVYKDNLKNRIAKNNKVLSTILCTLIVFINDILKGVYEDIHGVTSKNHIQGSSKMFIS